ncbi:hypothetical protein C0J45_15467 [Silurus meridionalis]|nr:hypothetical protein C0J45_15467 [Silurus meridionalis]
MIKLKTVCIKLVALHINRYPRSSSQFQKATSTAQQLDNDIPIAKQHKSPSQEQCNSAILESESLTVEQSETLTVKQSESLTVEQLESLTVEQSESITVEQSESLTVEQPVSLTVEQSESLTVEQPSLSQEGPYVKKGRKGEDSFELQTVELEMEALEKQIRELHAKHAQLQERKAALKTSWADAHSSQVNSWVEPKAPSTSTLRVSLPRPSAPTTRPAQVLITPAPVHHGPWMRQRRKRQAKPRSKTSPPPPPAFEISTENRFAPLRETEHDTVILGDSIVRQDLLINFDKVLVVDNNAFPECLPQQGHSTGRIKIKELEGYIPPYTHTHTQRKN